MLTLVETISLAGDRAKQNDDALGFANGRAWVIDGATDLDDARQTDAASDAGWIAHLANAEFHEGNGADLRDAIRLASEAALDTFGPPPEERWRAPIASLLMVTEHADGLEGIHLGDCRAFALDAKGKVYEGGAAPKAADEETQLAAQQTDTEKPLLSRTATIDMLRRMRGGLNQPGAQWTFSLWPECAEHAVAWRLRLSRPAHVLLMTDGFSSLTDRYHAFDAAALVQAALDKGLQELGRELRAIETADAASARHPRFKRSDDATAVLLRLT